MNQIDYHQDGTVSAVYTTTDGVLHHFQFPVTQAGYATRPDGSPDPHTLSIAMTCTDAGCSMTLGVSFPLTGDGVAQQAHAMFRYATSGGSLTLQQAVAAVIADIEAAGETPRIDSNGQPL